MKTQNTKQNPRVLLAGATGYLGSHILKTLIHKEIKTKVIVRTPKRLNNISDDIEVVQAQVTKPETLKDCCKDIDVVISTVGITRQKDGLTYMDVDYQANINLLNEAIKSRVKKFIYVSVINGDKHKDLKIFEAKEMFVYALKISGLEYTIVRPNGFFSDMKDFLNMAKSGKVFLFGDGNQKFNPIHGEDLAEVCVDLINSNQKEVTVGGPDVLSLNEISTLALNSLKKPIKIIHLPDWLRRFTIWSLRTFTSVKTYGPIEFFLTLMAKDNIAPTTGKFHLKDFFNDESNKI